MSTPKTPRRDPNFTMADLKKVGDKFLAAAQEYWVASHKAGVDGAVIWLKDSAEGFVLYTRGEYQDTILRSIPELGPVKMFGSVKTE